MKTIRMVFSTTQNKNYSLALRYAKDGLTEAQVRTAMQAVIDSDILTAPVNGIVGAELIETNVGTII